MTSKELQQSWEKTTGFLFDARSHISESSESIFEDQIIEFDSFIKNNELELALDSLDNIFFMSGSESLQVLELMAKAALNMNLKERCRKYDNILSKTRGWEYKTII